MKKFVKWTLSIVGCVLVFLLIALLAHPLWVGPAGCAVAKSIVPDMTRSEFLMDALDVNLYSGNVGVAGVALMNPGEARYDDPAVTLKALTVEFNTLSMLSSEKHIREIVIDGLGVYGDVTFSNIRQIVANVDEYSGDNVEVEDKKDEPNETEKSDSKIVIDRVFITGTVFKWGAAKVVLPDIEIKDIGREDDGVTEDGAFDAVVTAICDAADEVAVGSGKALKLAIESSAILADGVKAVTEAVSDVSAKAGEIGDKAVTKAGEIGDKVVTKAGEIGDKAVDKVVDKAGEIGGKAVDEIKKGLDGVRNLKLFK